MKGQDGGSGQGAGGRGALPLLFSGSRSVSLALGIMTAGASAEARAAASAAMDAKRALPQRSRSPRKAELQIGLQAGVRLRTPAHVREQRVVDGGDHAAAGGHRRLGAMFWAPPGQLLAWLATIFLAKGILISLCRQFLKAPRDDAMTLAWRTKIIAAEFLYGASWAAVAFVSIDTQDAAAAHLHLRRAARRRSPCGCCSPRR